MKFRILEQLKKYALEPVFEPIRRRPEMNYAELSCSCGSSRFRVLGWPWITSAQGGFFWRSLSRVWREARNGAEVGEVMNSPFKLPLSARCDDCELAQALFDEEQLREWLSHHERLAPQEFHRCRACRRGVFEISLGSESGENRESPHAVEAVSRCVRCGYESLVVWSGSKISEQEIRLDLLYGRR